jgi:hypothetical protein
LRENPFRVISEEGKVRNMMHKGFVPAGEVVADERARLAFGKAGVRRDDRYAVAVNDEGEILLTPLVSIPKRELFVWENQLVREQLSRGILESVSGELEDLGSFASYAPNDEGVD